MILLSNVYTLFLKVRLSQNEFMKSSIFQKMTKKFEGFLPCEFYSTFGRNPLNFLGHFLEN